MSRPRDWEEEEAGAAAAASATPKRQKETSFADFLIDQLIKAGKIEVREYISPGLIESLRKEYQAQRGARGANPTPAPDPTTGSDDGEADAELSSSDDGHSSPTLVDGHNSPKSITHAPRKTPRGPRLESGMGDEAMSSDGEGGQNLAAESFAADGTLDPVVRAAHYPSTGESSSQDSEDAEVEASKVKKILTSLKINHNPQGRIISIDFHINRGERGDTTIEGNLQGDHTIAHLMVIEAILNSTSLRINKAIESFRELAQSILEEEELEKFKKIAQPRTHETVVRKGVVRLVRTTINEEGKLKSCGLDRDQEDYLHDNRENVPQELSGMMKNDKITKLACHLANLTEYFLISIQKEPLTTFYSRGRMEKDPSHGDSVKGASRALAMLNKLCKLCNLEGEEFEEELNDFIFSLQKKGASESEESHITRYGLNRWNSAKEEKGEKEFISPDDLILTLQSRRANPEELKATLRALRNHIIESQDIFVKFMGDLIDYQNKIKFEIKEGGKEGEEKLLEEAFRFDPTAIKEQDGAFVVTRTKPTNLILILARFQKFISAAFKDLVEELKGQEKFDGIFATFIEQEILEKQGWKNCKILGAHGAQEDLKSPYLMEQVKGQMEKLAPAPAPGSGRASPAAGAAAAAAPAREF